MNLAAQARGQELIVGCVAASAAIATASTLADGEAPGIRLVAGVGVTAVGLATVNMFAPGLAGSFAVLMLTTTVFVYGGPAMDAIYRLTSEPKSKTQTGGGTSRQNTGKTAPQFV